MSAGNAWDHTIGTKGLGGWLFGHGPTALVPKDLTGLRDQNIEMLMSLLKPGAFDAGGAGSKFFFGGGDPTKEITPETSAFNTARPILEGMLTGTGPQFERDIAMANSNGGRFSSGNAILRGEALRNLYNGRVQTAQTLGTLAAGAGSSQFERMSQHLQLLAGLFGMSNQATMSLPVENDKGAFGDVLKLAAAFFGMKGGGGGGAAPPPAAKKGLMGQSFSFGENT